MQPNPFIEFEESIRWTKGFVRPEAEHFGIWRRRDSPKNNETLFLIDWKKKRELGPFSRQRIFRAYIRANSWMPEGGDEKAPWGLGFNLIFDQHRPIEAPFETYQRVDLEMVSPALTLYKWNNSFHLDPPIDFSQNLNPAVSTREMTELVQLYELPWPIESIAIGVLQEERNFHCKGATVLTNLRRPGELYAIVDGIENYEITGI